MDKIYVVRDNEGPVALVLAKSQKAAIAAKNPLTARIATVMQVAELTAKGMKIEYTIDNASQEPGNF